MTETSSYYSRSFALVLRLGVRVLKASEEPRCSPSCNLHNYSGQWHINLPYAFYLTFTKDFRHISAPANLPADPIPPPWPAIPRFPCDSSFQHLHTMEVALCGSVDKKEKSKEGQAKGRGDGWLDGWMPVDGVTGHHLGPEPCKWPRRPLGAVHFVCVGPRGL